MARKRANLRLSVGELELLEMLWREQSVTLSRAHEALGKPIGYTTVQTRLNRLVAKGVASRGRERPAIYRARVAPEDVSRDNLDVLVERVSGGNVIPLVAHLVRDRDLSADDIRQLQHLIDEATTRQRETESRS